MTAPALPALQVHADALQVRLRALADESADEVVGAFAVRVEDLRADLTALYVRQFGGVEALPPSRADAERFSRMARARVQQAMSTNVLDEDVLAEAIRSAHGMGVDHALDTTPVLPSSLPVRTDPAIPDLSRTVAEQLAEALSVLSESSVETSGFAAVGVASSRAQRAVTRIRATTAWEVTRAASDGVRDVAELAGAHVLWVAERDGCLHCLAYAGQSTTATGVFSPGLTYSDRPIVPIDPFTGPPLHSHCRCTLEVFDPRDQAVADALRREAKRSVLKGWSAYDGNPARLRAADRLLERGAGLPKTVEARARASVKRGAFEDVAFPTTPSSTPRALKDPKPLALSRGVQNLRTLAPTSDDLGSQDVAPKVSELSDEDLDAAMQTAMEAEDWDLVDEITAELDARDAAAAAPPEKADDWAAAWGHEPTEADEALDEAEEQRLEQMAVLVQQGYSESEAYSLACGISPDQAARQEAIARLREQYSGRSFEELARQSYRDHVRELYLLAEEACRGSMLNKAGRRARIDPVSLFSGPILRAAKYASEELKLWWEENERVTFDEWKAQLLGDSAGLRSARYSGSGRRFEL